MEVSREDKQPSSVTPPQENTKASWWRFWSKKAKLSEVISHYLHNNFVTIIFQDFATKLNGTILKLTG